MGLLLQFRPGQHKSFLPPEHKGGKLGSAFEIILH